MGLVSTRSRNPLPVFYSATNIEARLCRRSAAHVVGGGNSAGQAAMFLSQTPAEVSLVVRGLDLRKMSSHLSERILANRRVRIRYSTEVVEIEGVDHICGVHVHEPNGEIKEEFTSASSFSSEQSREPTYSPRPLCEMIRASC